MQSVSQPTLLALDVGNTRLKWAYYEAACIKAQGVVFLENIDKLSEQDWHVLPPPRRVLGCSVAGDAIRRRVTEQLELWDTPVHWVVPVAQKAGVINGYDHPARLGADRWVALIGARQRLLSQGLRQPCVVVMVGTAVTVDAVDASGNFLGGFILPGHGIMLRALESGTAGLRVPTGQVRDFPTNTSDALTSGGTFAITGAIEHMVHHVAQYSRQPPACIVTGGAGWKVMPHITVPCELVERLVFDGLLRLASDE